MPSPWTGRCWVKTSILPKVIQTDYHPGQNPSRIPLPPLLPTMRETRVQSLGREDPVEKKMETHSCNLAWRNPMDRGAWQATVQGVKKCQILLSN